jgi:hypothetical protein
MRYSLVLILLLAVLVPSFSEPTENRIVGFAAVPFFDAPKASEVIDALADARSDIFYGLGWEYIFDRIGFGGNFGVNFIRDDSMDWSAEWYGEAIYVSYHLFGAGAFFDLFGQMGLGSAGSVQLGKAKINEDTDASTLLTIGIFPFVSIGCAFNLHGFIIGTKLNYTPFISPPPATDFNEYPLKRVQAIVFIGISTDGQKTKIFSKGDCDCNCDCNCD